ncbi:MAG: glycosyltransferase family 4 protein [Phycisphaerae bacterium]|nr:glycosyltransferase family 4 protein [Phycisphaerae bacterium]
MAELKKRRVCVFTMHPTKDLRIFNRQCCSLQRNGWDVTLIGASPNGDYEEDGVKVIGIKKWASKWQRIRVILRIVYEAYKQKADIYHFHDPDLLIPAVFLRIFTFKPVIYDIHEFFHINQFEKLPNIWPLRQVASVCIWLMETICGVIIGRISAVYEEHIRRFSRLGCKTVYTPNYASIEEFVPTPVSEEEWKERRKTVLFIGTLDPRKGSLILLDIAKQIKKTRPDIQIIVTRRFLVKYQQDVMMQKMALPDYQDVIQFIPNVSGKELPKVVRQGGIGLSPIQNINQNYVAVPTKFFEYMSQAVPIVASDLPPSVKYVGNEGCGILVSPDDPNEYAEAIIKLVDNPQLAIEMGEKGQKAFIEKYNWGIIEKHLVEFYKSISE